MVFSFVWQNLFLIVCAANGCTSYPFSFVYIAADKFMTVNKAITAGLSAKQICLQLLDTFDLTSNRKQPFFLKDSLNANGILWKMGHQILSLLNFSVAAASATHLWIYKRALHLCKMTTITRSSVWIWIVPLKKDISMNIFSRMIHDM